MPGTLDNVTVAITEHRRERELTALIERYGACVLSCPLLEEVPVENRSELQSFVRSLVGGEFELMVFFTGVGVRFVADEARSMDVLEDFVAALGDLRLVVRGPKPIKALKELGLKPDLVPEVPTSEGLLAALAPSQLAGRRVGVQLYGNPNPEFCSELERRGARLRTVQVYNYGEASDQGKVVKFIETLVGGTVDVVTFTSAPQIRSLFRAAEKSGLHEALRAALGRKVMIAAVGDVTRRALRERGLDAAIRPDVPKMGPLARAIADHFEAHRG